MAACAAPGAVAAVGLGAVAGVAGNAIEASMADGTIHDPEVRDGCAR